MSYNYRILRDNPLAAYPLNSGETGGFSDSSGNALTSTIYGTLVEMSPLVQGGGSSRLVNNSNGFRFTPKVFTDITKDFSLEVWFKPVASGTIQVIGHNNNSDGIIWNGESLSFTTRHGAEGDCSAVYYPPVFNDAFFVVAAHTKSKNQLWVNSVLVAEANLTDAQVAAGYSQPSGELFVGQEISPSPSVMVDGVAVYRYALTEAKIRQHFLWGRTTLPFQGTITGNDGVFWTFDDTTSAVNYELGFNSSDTWAKGQTNGLDNKTGALKPLFDENGLTYEARWLYGVVLEAIDETLDGSKIEWDGDGTFIVQSSLDDGETWSTCINGKEIPGISAGFITEGRTLDIQVVFPSGEDINTITNIRTLSVKTYSKRSPIASDSRRTAIVYGNVSLASVPHQPLEYHDKAGINLYNGYVTIGKDTNADPTRAVELMVRLNSTPGGSVRIVDARDSSSDTSVWLNIGAGRTLSATGGTVYINGISAGSTALVVGQWYHVMIVLDADNLKNVSVGSAYDGTSRSDISVAFAAVYPAAFSAGDVSYIYNSYIGAPQAVIVDETQLKIQDDDVAAQIYAYTWSNNAA